jgi:hypothetical protein
LYNANNTYKPTYDSDSEINKDKIIYQPDYYALDSRISSPASRLPVKDRRELSRSIFKSNIEETNKGLNLINDKILKFFKELEEKISVQTSPVLGELVPSNQSLAVDMEDAEAVTKEAVAIEAGVGGSSRKYTRKNVRRLKQIRNTRRNNKVKNAANQTRRHSHKYRSSSTRRKRSLKNNK